MEGGWIRATHLAHYAHRKAVHGYLPSTQGKYSDVYPWVKVNVGNRKSVYPWVKVKVGKGVLSG